jgi:hypothetical protein
MMFGHGVHPSIDRSTDVKRVSLAWYTHRTPVGLDVRSDRESTLRLCIANNEPALRSHAYSRNKAGSMGYGRRIMGGKAVAQASGSAKR